MKKYFFLFLFAISLVSNIYGLKLNPIFTDNMVLQRDKPVRIYGKADPGQAISVRFNNVEVKGKASDQGAWEVFLPPMKAEPKPGVLLVKSGSTEIKIKNILIGDVWICSGQSNMGWKIFQSFPKLESYPYAPQIRVLTGEIFIASETPQENFIIEKKYQNSWQEANEEFANNVSGVSYRFAEKLHKELGIPIGIIVSAIGGTSLSSWTPLETLKAHPDYSMLMDKFNKEITWARENVKNPRIIEEYKSKFLSGFYNGMLAPLTKLSIKGMIWYQGENDVVLYKTYSTLFPEAIKSWRQAWAQGDFPFLFVQLPSWSGGENEWSQDKSRYWPYQRESQEKALELPNTGMAVTLDLGDYIELHPKNKKSVGERLALHAIALEKTNIITDGPVMESIEKKGNKAVILFRSAGDGLETRKVVINKNKDFDPGKDPGAFIIDPDKLQGFEVCGQDKIFHQAEAKIINKNKIELTSNEVDEIVHIRYAFLNFPLCNLYNSAGLPARPFRTDDFPKEEKKP